MAVSLFMQSWWVLLPYRQAVAISKRLSAGTKANYTFPAAAYNLKIHESVVPADARNSTEQYGTISVTADKGNASISFETETESQADTKGQTKDKNK